MGVYSQNSSAHKAIKFDRNAYLHLDYNLKKIMQFWGGWVGRVLIWYGLDL
jgi:hypothetical protein